MKPWRQGVSTRWKRYNRLPCVVCAAEATRYVGMKGYCEAHLAIAAQRRADIRDYFERQYQNNNAATESEGTEIPQISHPVIEGPCGKPSEYEYELMRELRDLES